MNLPPPTVMRNFRSHLDETLDEPFHGPFDLFAYEVELGEHVEEIVGQDPHEQPALVGGKAVAARLVPTVGGVAHLISTATCRLLKRYSKLRTSIVLHVHLPTKLLNKHCNQIQPE